MMVLVSRPVIITSKSTERNALNLDGATTTPEGQCIKGIIFGTININ
jgi:hypothetical protein